MNTEIPSKKTYLFVKSSTTDYKTIMRETYVYDNLNYQMKFKLHREYL